MQKLNFDQTKSLCSKAIDKNYNVLMIGRHGVGKTQLIKELCKEKGLKVGYWSAALMDPYIDLIGIPYPDKEKGWLQFAQRQDIFEYDILFFDELNRGPDQVRNSVLELILDKAICGKKLSNLKMVWAAINPPAEDYQVHELDPALRDRFRIFVELAASPNLAYFKTVMSVDAAECVWNWWNQLDLEAKDKCSPRRLEYLGKGIDDGFSIRDIAPDGIPLATLKTLEDYIKARENKGSSFTRMDFGNPSVLKKSYSKALDDVWGI